MGGIFGQTDAGSCLAFMGQCEALAALQDGMIRLRRLTAGATPAQIAESSFRELLTLARKAEDEAGSRKTMRRIVGEIMAGRWTDTATELVERSMKSAGAQGPMAIIRDLNVMLTAAGSEFKVSLLAEVIRLTGELRLTVFINKKDQPKAGGCELTTRADA